MRRRHRQSVIAAALLAPAFALVVWRRMAYGRGGSNELKAERFLGPFPGPLESPVLLALLVIVLSLVAIALATSNKRNRYGRMRNVDVAITTVAIALATWNLFAIM